MALPLLKEDEFVDTARTDWAAISEQRANYGLSEPDITGPARLMALCEVLGLACVEKDGLVFITMDTPSPATQIALVSADELFTIDETQTARFGRRAGRKAGATDMFSLKVAMYQDSCKGLRGPHAYLYVVDMDGWLAKAENRDIARMLEQDIRAVRKFVCGTSELAGLLANPFGRRYTGSRTPEFDVQRADQHPLDPPVRDFDATVTHAFVRVRDMHTHVAKLLVHPDAERLTAVANQLVRRVMGPDFKFVPGCPDVMLDRCGERSEMPWFCLGSGEQHGLAFCAYLALAFDDVTPESWLGISDVLTYLDPSHYFQALDALRDFIMATGANVYLQTNKNDYRELATSKFKSAVACVKARSN
jgi:hypothetical protein